MAFIHKKMSMASADYGDIAGVTRRESTQYVGASARKKYSNVNYQSGQPGGRPPRRPRPSAKRGGGGTPSSTGSRARGAGGARPSRRAPVSDAYRQGLDQQPYHYSFKIAVVGAKGVGKTSLLDAGTGALAAGGGSARDDAGAARVGGLTLRVRYREVDGLVYRVSFYDCPGIRRGSAGLRSATRHCAGTAGAILVYDVGCAQSFKDCQLWLREMDRTGRGSNALRRRDWQNILVGNKAASVSGAIKGGAAGGKDAPPKRAVARRTAKDFANENCLYYKETDVRTGLNVEALFDDIFSAVVDSVPNPPEPSLLIGSGIKLGTRMLEHRKFRTMLFASAAARAADQAEAAAEEEAERARQEQAREEAYAQKKAAEEEELRRWRRQKQQQEEEAAARAAADAEAAATGFLSAIV